MEAWIGKRGQGDMKFGSVRLAKKAAADANLF